MANVNTARKEEVQISQQYNEFLTSQVVRYDALKAQTDQLAAEMASIKAVFEKNLEVGESYIVDGKGFQKRNGAVKLTEAAVKNALGNCPECYILKFDTTAAKGALKVAGIEIADVAEIGDPTTCEIGFNK